jgi:hypothetical protein
MSLLSKLGGAVKDVFKWLGSPTGQAIIGAGESLAEAVDPGLSGIIGVANNWLAEIIKTEALASAASQQAGTGTQKAAITLAAVTPGVLTFAKQQGLPTPTAAKILTANNALVAFLNALDA